MGFVATSIWLLSSVIDYIIAFFVINGPSILVLVASFVVSLTVRVLMSVLAIIILILTSKIISSSWLLLVKFRVVYGMTVV